MSSPAPEETQALAAVRSWCGWHIAPERTETVKVEANVSREVLLLPSLRVTNVAEVRDEAGTTVSGWKARLSGILRGSWCLDEQYEVDMTHGYATMPIELAAVISQLDESGVGRTVASESAGPFSRSFSSDLEAQPLSVRSVVSRYMISAAP